MYSDTIVNLFIFSLIFLSLAPMVGPVLSVDRCADNSELSVTVTWPDLTLAQARGIVTSYTISWASYDGTTPTQLDSAIVNASAPNSYVINNLNPTLRYYVTAVATNSRGAGRASSPVIALSKRNNLHISYCLYIWSILKQRRFCAQYFAFFVGCKHFVILHVHFRKKWKMINFE